MALLQAILAACALIVVFIADRRIKSASKSKLISAEPVTEAIILQNLQTVSSRNQKLANLALCAFAASLLIQFLSVFNAANNQNQKNMNDIQEVATRVTKIERYIWGDGGNIVKQPPPNPPDYGSRLDAIEKKLGETQTVTNANANLALINKVIVEMRAELEELKQQVKASKRHTRVRAHVH